MAGLNWLSLRICVPTLLLCLAKVKCESDGGEPFCLDGLQFQGQCYWFSREPAKWWQAYHECSKYGDKVHLAVVTSQEQQDWLFSKVPYRDMWMGLHDTHEEGHWLWIDGTYPNYTNWASGHPSNSSDHNCAMMSHLGGHWVDQPCMTVMHYVCSSAPNPAICNSGGLFFRDRCYWQLPNKKRSFSSAQDGCGLVENGAQVVIIRDGEVNAFLSRLGHSTMWIGLTDTGNDRWQWVDGTPVTFKNWLPGQPSNTGGRENCATMDYETGGWNDIPCSGSRYHAVVCALPPCSEEGWRDTRSCVDASPYCTCVSGGYCAEVGKCHCMRRFPGMVCDKASVQVSLYTASHVDEGETIALTCAVNLPKSDYSIQFERIIPNSDAPDLPENRTHFFTEHEENGYYEVAVYNATTEDTGSYICVVSTTAGVVPLTRIDSASVTVGSNHTSFPGRISHPIKRSGSTVAVAILATACIFVLIAIVALLLQARRNKEEPENELDDLKPE